MRWAPSGFGHHQRLPGPARTGLGAAPSPRAHPGGGAYTPPQPYNAAWGVLRGLALRASRELCQRGGSRLGQVWTAYRPPSVISQVGVPLRAAGGALLRVGKLLCRNFRDYSTGLPTLPTLPRFPVGPTGAAALQNFLLPAEGGF